MNSRSAAKPLTRQRPNGISRVNISHGSRFVQQNYSFLASLNSTDDDRHSLSPHMVKRKRKRDSSEFLVARQYFHVTLWTRVTWVIQAGPHTKKKVKIKDVKECHLIRTNALQSIFLKSPGTQYIFDTNLTKCIGVCS